MQLEIGSYFDISANDACSSNDVFLSGYGVHGKDRVLLSTGRSAISFVLDDIDLKKRSLNRVALVPPFTCHTVIEPFLNKGYEIVSYEISDDLSIEAKAFEHLLKVSSASVVLFHRYYGFDTAKGIQDVIDRFRSKGVNFIEDLTQSIYSEFHKNDVDYYVGSFRKWGPIPDGGYAVCRTGLFLHKPSVFDDLLVEKKVEAFNMKYEYLHEGKGDKSAFFRALNEAEDMLCEQSGYYLMSPTSMGIQNRLDIGTLSEKRRQNYSYLYDKINGFLKPVTPKLTAGTVPLYLPVEADFRIELQLFLRKHKIYVPFVWPKPDKCPVICKRAEELYNSIICFPIDQRYSIDDMERMSECIKEFANEYKNS